MENDLDPREQFTAFGSSGGQSFDFATRQRRPGAAEKDENR